MIGINLVCCVLLTQGQWIVINATSVSRCDEVPVSLYLIMGQWQWKINYKLFSVLTWPHCAPPPAPPTGLWLHSSISSHTQSNQQLDIILIQFCPINKFILYLKTNEHIFPSQNSTTQLLYTMTKIPSSKVRLCTGVWLPSVAAVISDSPPLGPGHWGPRTLAPSSGGQNEKRFSINSH